MSSNATTGNQSAIKESWYKKTSTQKFIFVFIAIAPSYVGYWLFDLYPNALSIYYSLLDWSGVNEPKFVGLKNFVKMFQDPFMWRALWHNLFFMLTIPIITMGASLIIAFFLSNRPYKENSFYKVLFFFPNVLSTVVVALLWSFIYDGSFGLLNAVLKLIGIDVGNFYWLGSEATAIWALVPPWVWAGAGLYIIIFMNAMTGIPKSLYESAILEGASSYYQFSRITVPLIMPVVRVGALFLMLSVFKGFEMIMILTNGGPAGSTDVIGLYMFNYAFGDGYHNYGYASAIGMFLFVILVSAKFILDKILKPNNDIEY